MDDDFKWFEMEMVSGGALWRKVIKGLYGDERGETQIPSWSSQWWRDLWALDGTIPSRIGWLDCRIYNCVEEGNITLFWHDKWVGKKALKERYSRLFRLALDENVLISIKGVWNGNEWGWCWNWRRDLFVW